MIGFAQVQITSRMRLLNLLIHKCEILVLIVNYGCSATIESFPEEEVLIKNKT